MLEKLSESGWNSALDREASYKKYVKEIFIVYEAAPIKSKITDFVQIYIDENNLSQDSIVQGRVDAYQALLDDIRSLPN